MGAHARLGPSNHRWPNCPGSIDAESQYQDVSGAAAIDGTGSHELLELCLKNGVRADSYIGSVIATNHRDSINGWLVQDDRAERVQMCLDYVTRRVRELKEEYPGCKVTVLSETKSDPGSHFGRTDWWGTVDITIRVQSSAGETVFLEICDYKDGRGWVSVADKDGALNTQLLSYLAGKIPDLEMVQRCKYRISIVQPKTNPVVRYEDPAGDVVGREILRLADAAAKTDGDNLPKVPGKHCQWCKANPKRGGHCTAERDQAIQELNIMEPLPEVTEGTGLTAAINSLNIDVKEMSSPDLAKLADMEAGITSVFEQIRDEIQARIEQGQNIAGFAMRPGRATRVYSVDEAEVAKKLKAIRFKKDEISPPKLLTPAQLLKHPKLTDAQRTRLEEEVTTMKAGSDKLTRVAVGEESSVDTLFKDIPAEEVTFTESPEAVETVDFNAPQEQPAAPAEVSFF